MNKSKYKVGDVVVLKSGGPNMTITDVLSNIYSANITCTWITEAKVHMNDFPEAALKYKESTQ